MPVMIPARYVSAHAAFGSMPAEAGAVAATGAPVPAEAQMGHADEFSVRRRPQF